METNNLNNLPPFYIGQKVVANENYINLIKGMGYVVKSIIKNGCGSWSVNTGELSDANFGTCCKHGGLFDTSGFRLYNSIRFSSPSRIPIPITYHVRCY